MAFSLGGIFASPTAIILKDSNGNDKEFLLDATIRITTSLSAKATSYPVEGGGTISDHVQPEPLRLELTGVLSESPSGFLLDLATSVVRRNATTLLTNKGLSGTFTSLALAAGLAAVKEGLGSSDPEEPADYVKLLTDRSQFDSDYPKKAMQGMISMFNDGKPFNIRTYFSDVVYRNMVATSLTFPQDSAVGDSLKFSMSCVKITVANSEVDKTLGVSELKASDPAGSSNAPEKDLGALDGKVKEIAPADESLISSFRN